jgi:hypothetical protein
MSQVLLRRVLKGTGVESPIINYDDADRALRELADQLRYGESLKRSNASWVWLSVAKILRVDADRVGDLALAGALDPNRTVGEGLPEVQVDAIVSFLSEIRPRALYYEPSDEEEDFQWEAHDGDDDEDDEDDYEDLEDKDGESDDIEGSA